MDIANLQLNFQKISTKDFSYRYLESTFYEADSFCYLVEYNTRRFSKETLLLFINNFEKQICNENIKITNWFYNNKNRLSIYITIIEICENLNLMNSKQRRSFERFLQWKESKEKNNEIANNQPYLKEENNFKSASIKKEKSNPYTILNNELENNNLVAEELKNSPKRTFSQEAITIKTSLDQNTLMETTIGTNFSKIDITGILLKLKEISTEDISYRYLENTFYKAESLYYLAEYNARKFSKKSILKFIDGLKKHICNEDIKLVYWFYNNKDRLSIYITVFNLTDLQQKSLLCKEKVNQINDVNVIENIKNTEITNENFITSNNDSKILNFELDSNLNSEFNHKVLENAGQNISVKITIGTNTDPYPVENITSEMFKILNSLKKLEFPVLIMIILTICNTFLCFVSLFI